MSENKILNEELVAAVKHNNVWKVEVLLDKGASCDARDSDGWTVLMIACLYCYKSVVDLLLRRGADVDVTTDSSWTALIWAAWKGDDQIVDMLIIANANIRHKDRDGNKAVHLAIRQHHVSIAGQLVLAARSFEDLQVEDLSKLAIWACSRSAGYSARRTALVKMEDKSGCTLLHYAALHGMCDEVDLLLANEAYADAADENGHKAVHLAIKQGHMFVACQLVLATHTLEDLPVEDLLQLVHWVCENSLSDTARQATSVQMKDKSGHTLLHYAALHGMCDEIDLLLANKSDADAIDKDGNKAVHWAMRQGHMSIAGQLILATHSLEGLTDESVSQLLCWLVGNNADVAIKIAEQKQEPLKDDSGCTLLHYAAKLDHSDAVDLLLANKADADAVDKSGNKAIHLAIRHHHMSIVGQLVVAMHNLEDFLVENLSQLVYWACKSSLADTDRRTSLIQVKDKSGRTLLHYAAHHGMCNEVDLLLAWKADADAVDENGHKAVHLAIKQGHMLVAGQLVSATHTLEDLPVEDLSQLVHWVCEDSPSVTARQAMKDRSGCTLLHYAAHHGMCDEINLLLANKADADALDKNGHKAVHLAIKQGHMLVAVQLVSATHTLKDLSVEDLLQLVHWVCEDRPGVTGRQATRVQMKDRSGCTLLHYAAHYGMCDEIDLLLANKADADALDKNGDKAVQFAMREGHMLTACQLVLVTHTLEDIPIETRAVVYFWACKHTRADIAERVVTQGADLAWKDKFGRTLLHYAAGVGFQHGVEFLLANKADANATDKNGNKAVHLAMKQGHMSIAGQLVLATHNLEDLTDESVSQLLCWLVGNNADVAIKIAEKQRQEPLKDDSGCTLLHYAAKVGHSDAVDLLLANKADADAADKGGKRPYQLTHGELRRRLRKAIDEQKYAILYAEGTVVLDVMKVCFIGSEGAGKTTLMEAVKRGWIDWLFFANEDKADDPCCEEEQTAGINVLSVNIPGLGRLSLWDYASQRQFHKTHGLFFSGSNAFFILVVSLVKGKKRQMCSDEELKDEAQYWLSFLRASLDPDIMPTVLIVASRGDCHPNGQRVLQHVVDYMHELFKGKINISEVCFVLDCRKSNSPQMIQLKKFLGDVKKQFMQSGARYPRLCLPVVSKLLPSLRKRQVDPFMETPALVHAIEREACPGQDKKIVEKVIDFVHDTGEVIRVRDVTGLNPRWVCYYIIGPLLASDEFPCHMKRKRNDGKVTRSEVEEALQRFFAANNIKIQVSVDLVLALLESLGLIFKVEGEDDTYQFPAHLPVKKLAAMWIRNDAMKVFVGRRQICSSPTSIFSPSAYSLFQCRASITLDRQALLWRDGIIVEKVIEGRSPVQCLSTMTKRLGAVDFRVRGREGSEHECYSFLQEVISLWNEVVEEYSPGTECETGYLSYLHLCEHREQPAMYTEEAVQQVRAQGPSAFARLSTSDCTMSETLRELMVFPPPDTASYTSNKVLRAVQKVGSGRCYALGQAMGFTIAEVERITHHRVDYADKLLALFSVKGDEVGIEKAEDLLLSACENIQPAIDKDVKAELYHQ